IKLRKPHVRITSVRKNRTRLPALSGLSRLAGRREDELEAIRPVDWRVGTRGQAGVAFAGRAIMCPPMAEPQQPNGAKTLEQLFDAEPDRLSRLTFDTAGIYFDWTKTHLDQALVGEFLERAERMGFTAARDALFAGDIVNPSEDRPATHVAERGSGAPDEVD